jgi:hypothetical protein
MALLQNGYRDFSGGVRIFGATASNNAYPYVVNGNFYQSGPRRNLTAGEGVTTDLAGIPSGYRNQYAWTMPQKAGALSSRNEIEATSDLDGSGAMGVNGAAAIDGLGALEGAGQLVVSAVAAIVGTGSLDGNILAALLMAADLAGSGDASGALDALGWVLASLSGDAEITSDLNATGSLAADIDVSAQVGLSAEGIAEEILDIQLVETGLTVRETLRLCVAALAGKVSGAGGTTITIRSAVADDADRIIATVDNDGNRSALTYELG